MQILHFLSCASSLFLQCFQSYRMHLSPGLYNRADFRVHICATRSDEEEGNRIDAWYKFCLQQMHRLPLQCVFTLDYTNPVKSAVVFSAIAAKLDDWRSMLLREKEHARTNIGQQTRSFEFSEDS